MTRVHSICSLFHPSRQSITNLSASFAAVNQQAADTHTLRRCGPLLTLLSGKLTDFIGSIAAIEFCGRKVSFPCIHTPEQVHFYPFPSSQYTGDIQDLFAFYKIFFTNAATLLLIRRILRWNCTEARLEPYFGFVAALSCKSLQHILLVQLTYCSWCFGVCRSFLSSHNLLIKLN